MGCLTKPALSGFDEFADQSRLSLSRLQHQSKAAPLSVFAAMPVRNDAIMQAYATGRYGQKEIAIAFGLHYASVSRIVKSKNSLLADD